MESRLKIETMIKNSLSKEPELVKISFRIDKRYYNAFMKQFPRGKLNRCNVFRMFLENAKAYESDLKNFSYTGLKDKAVTLAISKASHNNAIYWSNLFNISESNIYRFLYIELSNYKG